jgi:hypothetical protein
MPAPEPASLAQIKAHYGPGVSAVLRASGFPHGASSFFVQTQSVDQESWVTHAVYGSREDAERLMHGLERAQVVTYDAESGAFTPVDEQPVSMARVVTLDVLLREGPTSIGYAMLDLARSDHEWLVSTEVGSEQKIALAMV